MNALHLPAYLLEEDRTELIRAWIDDGQLSAAFSSEFPATWTRPEPELWSLLLSDIAHHLCNALGELDELPVAFHKRQLKEKMEAVMQEERGTRKGCVLVFDGLLPELPCPCEDPDGIELLRSISAAEMLTLLRPDAFGIDDAEEIWANILYDLASLIAESFPRLGESARDDLLNPVLKSLREETELTGEFFE